ncbi:hypothetical protein [Pelagimonas varians]|uniref:Uncharacterized protein n=1 Tax=Pelagimonas varians TaxID=696760 RepID=A0A238L2T3_9RHOB|nr:hypothetical protein [Pelagimonas varians]PYG27161.1 hypothetical protein C8N36_1177 [Pelagimonas varians]SMX48646.1 hypothetical protein PEV8663_03881 [Pelagimonas varians]
MRLIIATLTAFLGLASFAAANTVDPVPQNNSNAVWFENWTGLSNATLVVSAPNGKVDTVFAQTGTPVYELDRGGVLDGVYRFELNAATEETAEIANPIDNGRESIATSQALPFHLSGSFVVSRGVIITPEDIKEE